MIDAHVDGRPMPRLLEPLHERRLGVAGRRLGAVAVRRVRGDRHPVALGQLRAARPSPARVLVALVDRLDVHLAVALERDGGARGGELGVGAVPRSTAPSRTLTVTPVASAICEASVRCQTSRYSDELLAVQLAGHLVGRPERHRRAGSPRGPPARSSPWW